MDVLQIFIESNEFSAESSEILEDVLAIVLDGLSIRAKISSSATGNVTSSPFNHEVSGSVATKLLRMMHNINVKLGDNTVYCPTCGSDEVFTSEDDEELRECNNCGSVWEIEVYDD